MKTFDTTPIDELGKVHPEKWLQKIASAYKGVDPTQLAFLKDQLEAVKLLGVSIPTDFQENAFEVGLRMAAVLGELNADIEALCAALWFQVLLHQGISREELLKKTHQSVAALVGGALDLKVSTAFSGLLKKDLTQMDRLRKMFLTMVNDARVVLVKLAERVVAMRLSKCMDAKRRMGLAESSLYIYAPLANRLGIGQLKWELEDRAFAVIDPVSYHTIREALDEKRIDREAYMANFLSEVRENLKDLGIFGEATGRVKHIYSIHRKMAQKRLSFDQLFDIRAIRILVKDVRACYEVLGYLHESYEPILSEFTDYIAMPKSNGYRSIHTVVRGPEDKIIEVQIRTFSMHEESEMGVAAHWRYKEGVSHDAGYEARIFWLRSLLDWQDHLGEKFDDAPAESAASDEREALRESMRYDHIYVFTPLGDVIDLETRSTPVDFAYRVHTEVGHRCRGAKVNDRMVPLTYELRTGDRVEILTGKESKPSRDWLRKEAGFARSTGARQKIAAWFRQQEPKAEVKAEAKVDPKAVPPEANIPIKAAPKKTHSGDLIIEGENNLLFKMAGCCRPILGDVVGGYITQGRGISVHLEDCKSFAYLKETHPERLVTVSWGDNTKGNYLVELHLEAHDRPGLLKDVTNVLVGEKLSIVSMRSFLDPDGVAKIAVAFMVKEKDQVSRVTNLLMRVPKMLGVRR